MNTNTFRNRLLHAACALLLGLPFVFGQAQATGVPYDGIYQWSPGNFLSLHQDGTHMIATIYFTNDGNFSFPTPTGVGVLPVPQLDLFDLMSGPVTGSIAHIDGTRFHRACNVGYDFTFNIDSSITVTRIGVSNTPAANSAGISCSSIVGMEAATMSVPKIRFNPNTAPVANAGSARSVVAGTLVTLDGSASTDADGSALTYAWTLTTKPAGSAGSLSSATSVKPTFTADVPGTYVATLIVNDGSVNSSAATVSITAAANVAPVANAGTAQTVSIGTVVTLDGSTSSDANGDPLTYFWSFVSVPNFIFPTISNPTSIHPTFLADSTGTYVIKLQVSDRQAYRESTITVTVTSVQQGTTYEIESNDTQSTANGLTLNSTMVGRLMSGSDADWFKINLSSGVNHLDFRTQISNNNEVLNLSIFSPGLVPYSDDLFALQTGKTGIANGVIVAETTGQFLIRVRTPSSAPSLLYSGNYYLSITR